MSTYTLAERRIPRLRFPVALAGSNISGMETPTAGVAIGVGVGIAIGVGIAVGAAIGIAIHKGTS